MGRPGVDASTIGNFDLATQNEIADIPLYVILYCYDFQYGSSRLASL